MRNHHTLETSIADYSASLQQTARARTSIVDALTRHPYQEHDLMEHGLTRAQARTLRAEAERRGRLWEAPDYFAERPQRTYSTGVVGVVPSNERTALPMIRDYGIYLRWTGFKTQQLFDEIDHLATDSEQKLQHLYPIEYRYTLGSAAAAGKRKPGMAQVRAYLNSRETPWEGPADVLILGEPIDFSLPLGYDGKGGIAGVSHVRLDDLLRAKKFKGINRGK